MSRAEELLERSNEATGVSDFGDCEFHEGYEVLTDSLVGAARRRARRGINNRNTIDDA